MAEPIIGQDRSLRRARMSRWLAACSVALGVGVLFGWFLGLDPMTRVLPGLITMKPNAALGFLLAGLALGSIREVHPAGRQAVEGLAISPGDFDAVLMDLAMPEMGGFQALEAIRLRERIEGGRLPIVALTAHAMAGDRERCLAAPPGSTATCPSRSRPPAWPRPSPGSSASARGKSTTRPRGRTTRRPPPSRPSTSRRP
jgi:CheY-like chemotaxis protein